MKKRGTTHHSVKRGKESSIRKRNSVMCLEYQTVVKREKNADPGKECHESRSTVDYIEWWQGGGPGTKKDTPAFVVPTDS